MRRRLEIPFRDAAADDLAWSLRAGDAARPPAVPDALARLDVPLGDRVLRLEVLGASHAATLVTPAGALVEVVACGAPEGRALPDAPGTVELDGRRYAFDATVQRTTADAVRALAGRLAHELDDDPHALVAEFPGLPGAVTALRAATDGDALRWRTWHLYPERGEIVRTDSAVTALVEAIA